MRSYANLCIINVCAYAQHILIQTFVYHDVCACNCSYGTIVPVVSGLVLHTEVLLLTNQTMTCLWYQASLLQWVGDSLVRPPSRSASPFAARCTCCRPLLLDSSEDDDVTSSGGRILRGKRRSVKGVDSDTSRLSPPQPKINRKPRDLWNDDVDGAEEFKDQHYLKTTRKKLPKVPTCKDVYGRLQDTAVCPH